MATIAVIIPTYNRAGLIVETLDSVLSQTRKIDEIIVVDDGSTDATRDVVTRFNSAIRYVYQHNHYLGAARQTGLELSRADYLLFLDSDDLLFPMSVATLEACLEANPLAAVAYGRVMAFGADGPVELHTAVDAEGEVWNHLVCGNFIRTTGCALVRRSALQLAGPWDKRLRGNEDWDMWLRLAENHPFARVMEPVLKYRIHSASMTSSAFRMHRTALMLQRKHVRRNRKNGARYRLARIALKDALRGIGLAWTVAAAKSMEKADFSAARRHLAGGLRLCPLELLRPSNLHLLLWSMKQNIKYLLKPSMGALE